MMLCYRDITFCESYKDCRHGEGCDHALTEKVIEAAHKWWGSESAPIAAYHKLSCFEKKEDKK